MSLLRKLAYTASALLLILVVIGLLLPATAHVERSIRISAPPASVFALVNDFRQINKWSPWVASDPNARYTISGPTRGVGATITWDGEIVGQGTQVILESEPDVRVVSRLDLGGQGIARASLELRKVAGGTSVVWRFENDSGLNIIGRYFGLVLDGIVGPNYAKGLSSLKAMAERLPGADFSDIEIEHLTVEATDIAFRTTTSAPATAAKSRALGEAYFRVLGFMDRHHLTETGAPISIVGSFDGSKIRFDAAIPISGLTDTTPANDRGVRIGRTYSGFAIRATHVGSYRNLGATHDKIAAYLAALGMERNGNAWESYVSDPASVDEAELVTYIYYPVQPDNYSRD